MNGRLEQISISRGGLPKLPIAGPVMLDVLGIEGDHHNSPKFHGGPDKAVLMVAAEIVDRLAVIGFPVCYGALGENLTVAGLDPHFWRSGQRYRVGEDAVIELTTLRTPCLNLNVYGESIKAHLYDALCKAGNAESPRWAWGGFYARVIHTGLLFTGAPVTVDSVLA